MSFRSLLRHGMMVLLLLVVSSPVYAGGIGLYFKDGRASDVDWDGDYNSHDSDSRYREFGFTADSNLATDKMFNYRLELGRSYLEIDNFNNSIYDAELDGMAMTHTFGFGGLIAPSVRFWFGPELRVALLEGELDGGIGRDFDLFGWGVGGAAGLNMNLPGKLTLAVKGGFVMMRYLGDGPNWDGGAWQNSDYDVDEDLAYISVSMYFRTLGRK